MPLEINPGAEEHRLRRELRQSAIRKPAYSSLSLFKLLKTVDRDDARDRFLNCRALGLEVVPDHPMRVRRFRAELHQLRDAGGQTHPLLLSGVTDADCHVLS